MTRSKLIFLNKLIFVTWMMLGYSYDSAAQSTLTGKWQTGEDNSIVQVEETSGVITGKLVSSDNPKAKMGTEILRDFKQAKGVWSGRLYAAKKDKLYDATLSLNTNTLNIKVSAGIVNKKLAWQRVEK